MNVLEDVLSLSLLTSIVPCNSAFIAFGDGSTCFDTDLVADSLAVYVNSKSKRMEEMSKSNHMLL